MTTPDDTFREHQQDAQEAHAPREPSGWITDWLMSGKRIEDIPSMPWDQYIAWLADHDDGTGRHPTHPPEPTAP